MGIKCLVVIGNSITNENLITVKELINNWQIASILKKKMFEKFGSNWPDLRPDSTCDPIDLQPDWPVLTHNPIDSTRTAHFATSTLKTNEPTTRIPEFHYIGSPVTPFVWDKHNPLEIGQKTPCFGHSPTPVFTHRWIYRSSSTTILTRILHFSIYHLFFSFKKAYKN